jgi:hypothetical protein
MVESPVETVAANTANAQHDEPSKIGGPIAENSLGVSLLRELSVSERNFFNKFKLAYQRLTLQRSSKRAFHDIKNGVML